MANDVSRRHVIKGALAVAAAGVSTSLTAQDVKSEAAEGVEKELKVTLTDEAKKLLQAALASSRQASAARLKFGLPENSEPCFQYHPTPHVEKKL